MRSSLHILLLILLLSGCAQVKYTMHLDPALNENRSTSRVWPDPPEKARFRYVGQLIGEHNLVAEDATARNTGRKLFYWLVGLVGMEEAKLELLRPQTGMTDEEGRIYVTDVSKHAVFVFDQMAGKLSLWDRALETVGFVTPVGIAQGARGEILVADADLQAVFRLDRDGKPLGAFGNGVLERPTGLARDAQRGRVYVADTHGHDVKVFDDDGHLIEILGARGDGNGEGQMNFPTHLAFAGDKLYVTDGMNARVVIFDAHGKQIATFGRRGLYVGEMSRPKGVAVDASGNIYVVESFYDNLLVFNSEGRFLMPIGGTGKEIGQFYLPSGVWTDREDRIYVADMFNGRVVIFQFLGGD